MQIIKFFFCLNFSLVFFLSNSNASDFEALKSNVHKIELENGLKVIVFKRDTAPVFSGQVWVKVGGSDELPGASGAAHLLEHMAFKGTETIGTQDYAKEKKLINSYDSLFETERQKKTEKGQARLKEIEAELEKIWDLGAYTTLLQERGANGLNAGTSKDYTVYTVSLPSSELEFWFFMESERLLKPVFRQFYKELDVVHEERRMRTDDNPSGKLYEALLASAYWDHPYGRPTIGWKEDLNNLLKKDAEYLHQTYYRPDNMVLTVVGDVDIEEVKKLSEMYFGRLKRPKASIPQSRINPEVQYGERTAQVIYPSEPMLMIGYHIPTTPSPESLHFTLLGSIIDDGRSSLLQKILVQDEELASGISTTEAPGHRYDPLFLLSATPRTGVSYDVLVNRIQSILDSTHEVKSGKESQVITEEDLTSARKRIKLGILKSLQSNSGLARMLGANELLYRGWESLFEELELLEKVSLEDIKTTAAKYLTVENRTVVQIDKINNAEKE